MGEMLCCLQPNPKKNILKSRISHQLQRLEKRLPDKPVHGEHSWRAAVPIEFGNQLMLRLLWPVSKRWFRFPII